MLIRKNTKAFKSIHEIIKACQHRPDRERLVRLYITKAGHSVNDRISIEGIQGDAAVFYELNYHAVLGGLESSTRQLHQSDDVAGIYFFRSASNKLWDETPFEFDEAIRNLFTSLSDLPTVRKKGKVEKLVLPDSHTKTDLRPVKKEKVAITKAVKPIDKGPRQPNYQTTRDIQFSDLDKIVFRKSQLTKKDVLDYYNKIAELMLPYMKDRRLVIRLNSKGGQHSEFRSLENLPESVEIPDWIKTAPIANHEGVRALLCNDKDHLLFYVEIGCVEFNCWHSRVKSLDLPDYIIIIIESPGNELGNAIDVALTAKDILLGLQLPSFVKTDGQSGLHIYVPLDSKSEFETCRAVAEHICKLVRIKVGDLVVLEGSNDQSYGKVSLNYLINEAGKSVVVPYSLVSGELATVATPLLWEEVNGDLQLDHFNTETIFKRLKQIGDPFEFLFKKKVNADALLERMEANYSFLY